MVLNLALIILLVQGFCCLTISQTTAPTTDPQELPDPTQEADHATGKTTSTAATEKGIFAFSTFSLVPHA